MRFFTINLGGGGREDLVVSADLTTLNGVTGSFAGQIGVTQDNEKLYVWNTTSGWVRANDVDLQEQIHIDSFEPTGFANVPNATFAWSDAAPDRTLIVSPTGTTFSYYISGTKYYSTTQALQIPDSEGSHWFYMDGGTLSMAYNPSGATMSFIIREKALVSNVYWDSSESEAVYVANELHGYVMDGKTHAYLHKTGGTKWVSGLALGDITADGDGSSDTHSTCSVSDGLIYDEDLAINIVDGTPQTLSSTAQIPVYYKTGSGEWQKDTATDYPVKSFVGGDSLLAYNLDTAGTWSQEEISNNSFVLTHIFATNDIYNPIIAVQGEAEYGNQISARLGAINEISTLQTAGLPFAEFTVLGTIIYQTSTTYSNTTLSRIVTTDEGEDYVDFRTTNIDSVSVASDHGNLSGLADDDHSQYAGLALTGRTAGQTFSTMLHGTTTVNFPIINATFIAGHTAALNYIGATNIKASEATINSLGTTVAQGYMGTFNNIGATLIAAHGATIHNISATFIAGHTGIIRNVGATNVIGYTGAFFSVGAFNGPINNVTATLITGHTAAINNIGATSIVGHSGSFSNLGAGSFGATNIIAYDLQFPRLASAPGNASASFIRTYYLDNVLYQKDESGAAYPVAGNVSGGINYISANDAEDSSGGVTGWDTDDGAGGAADIAWTSQATTVLRGSKSFEFGKPESDCDGQFAYYPFTVDEQDKNKILFKSFDVDASDANYVVDYLDFDVQSNPNSDFSGTTTTITLRGSIVNGRGTFSFPTNSDDYYRIRIKVNTDTITAWDVYFDNFIVGPDKLVDSPIVTDWESFTPTLTNLGNATASLSYKRLGDSLFIRGKILIGSTTPTSTLIVSLPSGLTANVDDTNYVNNVSAIDGSTNTHNGQCYIISNNLQFYGDDGGDVWNATTPFNWVENDRLDLYMGPIQIDEWANQSAIRSTTEMMNETLDFSATCVSKTLDSASWDTIDGCVEERDTSDSFNPTTGIFTAPKTGKYVFRANVDFNSNATGVRAIRFNVNSGSTIYYGSKVSAVSGSSTDVGMSKKIYLNAGDTVEMQAFQSSGGTLDTSSTTGTTWFDGGIDPDFSVFAAKMDGGYLGELTTTSSWTTNTTTTGYYWKNGGFLKGLIRLDTSGAPDATPLAFTLPNGLAIDPSKMPGTVSFTSHIDGSGIARDDGTATYRIVPKYKDTTSFYIAQLQDGTGSATNPISELGVTTNTRPFTWASGDFLEVSFELPIVGWEL